MKTRWSLGIAEAVAADIIADLAPACEPGFCIAAGSVRRKKESCGDVEILYIPKLGTRPVPGALFGDEPFNCADAAIAEMERTTKLLRRTNVNGSEMFGEKNKLMRHRITGMPVDLFATTPECWRNYLVCRTGPSESNIRIAEAARKRGWKWNPCGTGFSRITAEGVDEHHVVTTEEAVFAFVGLPYLKPEERT